MNFPLDQELLLLQSSLRSNPDAPGGFKDSKLNRALKLYERQKKLGRTGDRQIQEMAKRAAEIWFSISYPERDLLDWVPEIKEAVTAARKAYKAAITADFDEAAAAARDSDIPHTFLHHTYYPTHLR